PPPDSGVMLRVADVSRGCGCSAGARRRTRRRPAPGLLLERGRPGHTGVGTELGERLAVALDVAVPEVDGRLFQRYRLGVVAGEEWRHMAGAEERQQELGRLRARVRVPPGLVWDRAVGVSVETEQRSGVPEVVLGALDHAGEPGHRDGGADSLVATAAAERQPVRRDPAE